MSFSPLRLLRRILSWSWQALDASRRVFMNLLFLLLVAVLVLGFIGSGPKKLQDRTALLLDFKGALAEQNAASVSETLVAEVKGSDAKKTTQLRDVLAVLDQAAADPKITSAVLLLDDLQSAGLPMLREVAAALDKFKTSGKPVIAWGSGYDQKQYYLAAHASEVYMHPMGTVALTGFGRYRNYYRDALDKLGITVNLMKVGTYKSFAEPYIANAPSPAATEAEGFLYNAMWASYTEGVEKARKLPAGSIMETINDLPQKLASAGGDVGKLVLESKLVDGLKTRDELRQMMIRRGARDEHSKSFRQIEFEEYLAHVKPKLTGDAVGVIVAEGDISDGMAPSGSIGGLSTSNLIRQAREDEQIKAIVLRVNSPGGSAFGSELIRKELELTRAAGKPVVISMGNLAASGGYWISMASDEVVADPTTITGSIGVFTILPTAEKAMDKIGVHTGGVTTTWLSDGYNPLRPLDPRFAEIVQSGINHIYSEFTTKAAQARKTTPQKIDEVAQGRVWTGQQAKERGLVDTLGSYGDALKSAAQRAKLGDDYRVAYIEREPGKLDRVLNIFGASFAKVLDDQFKLAVVPTGVPPAAAKQIAGDMLWLSDLTSGRKSYMAITHCLCQEP